MTRLLTVPTQWEHVRSVLAHVADHAPLPGPEARLLVLMLTLRTAHTGTGNLVGQDVNGLGLTDPRDLVEKLTGCGWSSFATVTGTATDWLPAVTVSVAAPFFAPRSHSPSATVSTSGRSSLASAAQVRSRTVPLA